MIHGHLVQDPFRWLEHGDDPAVVQWIATQNTFARTFLDPLPSRNSVLERLKKTAYAGTVDAPVRAAGRLFYMRRSPGEEKAVLYLRDEASGAERILLDPNSWSRDKSRALDVFWPSHDGRKLVISTSENNADAELFEVLDVDAGTLSDRIDGVYNSEASWSRASDGFYYRWSPTDGAVPLAELPGHAEVRFHKLGSSLSSDLTIRAATGDPAVTEYVTPSDDGRWLLLQVQHGSSRMDAWFRDLRVPQGKWTLLSAADGVMNTLSAGADSLLVLTDEGAPHGRLFRIDPALPQRSRWIEIVPERKDATLRYAFVVGKRVVLLWNKNDISELESVALDGSDRREIALPGLGYVRTLVGRAEDASFFATFETYTAPIEILECTPGQSNQPKVWQRPASTIDPDAYVTEQHFYTSKDGTRVPMFIVRRRETKPSGDVPTVYWGYGGFSESVRTHYAPQISVWLDMGGIYAEAAIRGGGDYGEEWHRAGMRTNKQNVIDDYIFGAESLVTLGWTNSRRMFASGGSNGGLLIGASIVQRPDLFIGAFIRAPILDMVRYPLGGGGRQWADEYGSPDDPGELGALLSYSPYHNVKPDVRYPAVLLYSPDSDDRVDPMHARKFAAALQGASRGGPVLLSIGRASGHAGPTGVGGVVDKWADAYAFAFEVMGIHPPSVLH